MPRVSQSRTDFQFYIRPGVLPCPKQHILIFSGHLTIYLVFYNVPGDLLSLAMLHPSLLDFVQMVFESRPRTLQAAYHRRLS